MQGLHLTADLFQCKPQGDLLFDLVRLRQCCLELIEKAELCAVGDRFHRFPDFEGHPGGVTGMVLLAESHLALHTWPEHAAVTLDVYVCNFSTDNSVKAEELLQALIQRFAPASVERHQIERGGMSARGGMPAAPQTIGPVTSGLETRHLEIKNPQVKVPERQAEAVESWFDERLNAFSRYGYKLGECLHSEQSPFQHIEVFESQQFGRLFRLDGDYMTSERDEFFYHEAMIHPAAVAIGSPKSALVLGGGDGGSAEELLKYPCIERVVIAELDEAVVNISRHYFASIHRGALDDPRVELQIGDGVHYVQQSKESFDLVILDLTDPDTPAETLYTEAFFSAIRQKMTPQGAMVLHTGSPIFKPDAVARLHEALRRQFKKVAPMGLYIPLYGSYWTIAVCSAQTDPRDCAMETVRHRLQTIGISDLSYYNPEIHSALFALPNYLKKLLDIRDEKPPREASSGATAASRARAA